MRRLILLALLLFAAPLRAETALFGDVPVTITAMADRLTEPWAIGFLPDGGFLITERAGRLWHFRADGTRQAVRGVPDVVARGQGGLLDLVVARDFARSRTVFLSFARPQGRHAGTAMVSARLSPDGGTLSDIRLLFEMAPGSTGGRHFGSRIVEARDGTLFLTVGERGDRPSAQDLSRQNGSVVRVARDGTVPADNPHVGRPGAAPEIWSHGHRNPQGAALDPAGNLWITEHGARGGDELNRIERGANFGWPVIAYGRHYSGLKIGEGTAKPGMSQPAHYWDPSIAPSGLAIHSGRLWPEWRGDFFVGSLKFDRIERLSGTPPRPVAILQTGATGRVRDIREAPDGSLWFLSVARGAAFRITPAR